VPEFLDEPGSKVVLWRHPARGVVQVGERAAARHVFIAYGNHLLHDTHAIKHGGELERMGIEIVVEEDQLSLVQVVKDPLAGTPQSRRLPQYGVQFGILPPDVIESRCHGASGRKLTGRTSVPIVNPSPGPS
jgi:hypothetical protein